MFVRPNCSQPSRRNGPQSNPSPALPYSFVRSEWSDCSEDCGPGMRRRQRECNSPLPSDGGADCVGAEEEEEPVRSERPAYPSTPPPPGIRRAQRIV